MKLITPKCALHYVDVDGVVRCTNTKLASGLHYEFEQKPNYINVMIVRDSDSEVTEDYVGWESLAALEAALKGN